MKQAVAVFVVHCFVVLMSFEDQKKMTRKAAAK